MSRRRIIMLFFFIVISFLFLISSTYAWFNLSTDIESTGISVRVNAVESLEISTDAKTWRKSLTLHDILNADYEVTRLNQIPVKFQPVSTTGNINNGYLDMYLGIVSTDKDVTSSNYGNYILTSKKEVEQDGELGKFLVFDLYFKSDSTKPIYLGKKSYVTYQDESTGIENTVRVAFVKEGTIESSDIKTIQSMISNNNEDVVIWEPNYDSHTESAITVSKKVYGLDIANRDTKKISYYGIKSEIVNPVPITSKDTNYFEIVDNIVYTDNDYSPKSNENILLFYLNYGITKVRVYAWVEGQDVDCENNAAGSSFVFDIHFADAVNSEEE